MDIRPQITTHDKTCMKSKAVFCLQEAENEVWQYAVVAIDEGQFLPGVLSAHEYASRAAALQAYHGTLTRLLGAADLVKYAEKWANEGKTVMIAALDSTYLRQPFEHIQAIIPLAENVVKLSAVCKSCLGEAAFTFRIGLETDMQASYKSDVISLLSQNTSFIVKLSKIINTNVKIIHLLAMEQVQVIELHNIFPDEQVVGGADKYEARCRACYREGERRKAEGKGDGSMYDRLPARWKLQEQ